MTKKYTIAVDVVLTSPMHISAIEQGSYDVTNRRLMRYPSEQGIQATLTRTSSVLSSARPRTSSEANGAPDNDRPFLPSIPTIPSSTLGGKLRRAAAELVFDSLIERSLQLDTNSVNTMTSGTSTVKLFSEDAGPDEIRMARLDPFFGNFGGTAMMLSSGLVVSEGLPLLKMVEHRMTVPAISAGTALDLEHYEDMTSVLAVIRKNDIQAMRDIERLEGVLGIVKLADYIERINAQSEDSSANKAEHAEAKKAAKEKGEKFVAKKAVKLDLRAFNAIETVNADMPFGFRVEVKSNTPAHLGLMLLSMRKFMVDGQVGGKGARGFGRFKGTSSRLFSVDPESGVRTPISNIFGEQQNGYEFVDNDEIMTAVDAAKAYIAAADPLFFESFSRSEPKPKKVRAKKGEAATAEVQE